MNHDTRTEHIARQNVLMLLSDDEVASVSTAETTTRPLDGEEYLDLEDLDQGVRSALGKTPPMGRVLLRRSVHAETWTKIDSLVKTPKWAKNGSPSARNHWGENLENGFLRVNQDSKTVG